MARTKRAGMLRPAMCCLLLVLPLTPAADPTNRDYLPVSPAPALHAGLQASLKLVQDWLADKDFLSATEASQQLAALATLYTFQSAQPDWRTKIMALRATCER